MTIFRIFQIVNALDVDVYLFSLTTTSGTADICVSDRSAFYSPGPLGSQTISAIFHPQVCREKQISALYH